VLRIAVIGGLGLMGMLLFSQAVLESSDLSAAFASLPTWQSLVSRLGGATVVGDRSIVSIPLTSIALRIAPFVVIALVAGSWLLRRGTGVPLTQAALRWADQGGKWWLIPGTWWLLSTLSLILGLQSLNAILDGTCELWFSMALAGSINAWFTVRAVLRHGERERHWGRWLTAAVITSGLLFTAMNWGLWFNLRIPHGDSAMYEEHLWNVEHGKGFRSYLDQGLFLGEHVQVVHLLLLPLHWLWPSQLLLELVQAFALATGAIPVFRMAMRFSGSPRAGLLLAAAYLLNFGVQYLDLTIDLKTFRPNSMGVPALLFALDALERGRRGVCVAWLALMLSAQEDYAIVMTLLGAWLVLTAGIAGGAQSRWSLRAKLQRILSPAARPQLLFGAALAAFGALYLAVVMKVVFPFFRDGATIHYATYFDELGKTPEEIFATILTRPLFVIGRLINVPTVMYAAALLVPMAGLPLRSPGRLLVAAPLFALVCLNKLALQPPAPVHHFHASLVPLLYWAAAAGLRPGAGWPGLERSEAPADSPERVITVQRARFACLCALATGLFMSLTPLGFKFWDAGGSRYWGDLYVPSERARLFPIVEALIPADARVASTDFVHARLTHRERSYDYSDYVRKVADYEDRVPGDTGWIVIDIEHPYHSPEQAAALRSAPFQSVRELRDSADEWQLVDHPASKYFIVLQRREANDGR
jgi:uncharacterized membrane protein